MWERAVKKGRSFRMCLNLNVYQFLKSRYSYRSTYMNAMVTTNQKPTIDIQKEERKEHRQSTKENHQTTKENTDNLNRLTTRS